MKRILAFVLCLVLTLGMMPAALAETTEATDAAKTNAFSLKSIGTLERIFLTVSKYASYLNEHIYSSGGGFGGVGWAGAGGNGEGYFAEGEAPEHDSFVYWFLRDHGAFAGHEVYQELDDGTRAVHYWNFTYDEFLALVDSVFASHTDMKKYLATLGPIEGPDDPKGYDEETGEIHFLEENHYFGGDPWDWVMLNSYTEGNRIHLQGVYLQGWVWDDLEDLVEGVDYYYTNRGYAYYISNSVELVLEIVNDDYRIVCYTTIDKTVAQMLSEAAATDPTLTVPGDMTGDGKVNAFDYLLLKRYVLGTLALTDEQMKVADVNHNGKVDALDYMLVKRAVLGTYVLS